MIPIPPELVLSLSPPVLRDLLATFGAPKALARDASPEDTALAIFRGALPAAAERAFRVVARFGTERGRDALVEAGRAAEDARVESWLREPAVDVAAKLHLAQAKAKGKEKRALARLFKLAAFRLERLLARHPSYDLLAEAPAPPDEARVTGALRRALGSSLHRVFTHAAKDGALHIAALVHAPEAAYLTTDAGAVARRTARPLVVDHIHLSPDRARFSLTTAIPQHLPRYASALGLSHRPSFTLRPFHDATPESLALIALPGGVRSVTVVALLWRAPGGTRRETRALDGRSAMDPAARAHGGYVERATLRFDLVEFDRPVDAFLYLPHRIEISLPEAAPLVREALAALGVFAPGALPDDAHSLAPFVHGEWRWRAVLGDAAFELLVARKLLVPATTAHVATASFRSFGAAYIVRDVPGEPGLEYAMAEDASFGARLVRKEDRVAFRLDEAALALSQQNALGARAPSRENAIVCAGVLDLGTVALGDGVLRFVYLLARPAAGWERAVRDACRMKQTPVVLVPKGWSFVTGMLEIELDVAEQLGAASIARALGRAAMEMGAAEHVEAWRLAEEEVFLEKATSRAWLRGTLLTRVSEKPFRLLEHLATHAGQTIASKELGAYVSKSDYPDVAARRAKADLERQVRESLIDSGIEPAAAKDIAGRLVIVDGRRGYRLGTTARVS